MSEVFVNSRNQNQEKNVTKSKVKLSISKDNFPSLIETAFGDTDTFCELINSIFCGACPQFYGSKIEIAQNRRIVASLYFNKVNNDDDQENLENTIYKEGSGQYKIITPVLNKANTSTSLQKIKAYNFMHQGGTRPKAFTLTEDGKSILSDFVPSSAYDKKGNIHWDSVTNEIYTSDNFGRQKVTFGITIDFIRLIKKVYGAGYSYSVMVGNPVNQAIRTYGGNTVNQNWQIFILRASNEDIDALARRYGFASVNNMGIIAAR